MYVPYPGTLFEGYLSSTNKAALRDEGQSSPYLQGPLRKSNSGYVQGDVVEVVAYGKHCAQGVLSCHRKGQIPVNRPFLVSGRTGCVGWWYWRLAAFFFGRALCVISIGGTAGDDNLRFVFVRGAALSLGKSIGDGDCHFGGYLKRADLGYGTDKQPEIHPPICICRPPFYVLPTAIWLPPVASHVPWPSHPHCLPHGPIFSVRKMNSGQNMFWDAPDDSGT